MGYFSSFQIVKVNKDNDEGLEIENESNIEGSHKSICQSSKFIVA